MKRLLALVALVCLFVLAGCGKGQNAGCYAYNTKRLTDEKTYVVLIDSPADAHVDWEPLPADQEQCRGWRDAGFSGKTIAEIKALANP